MELFHYAKNIISELDLKKDYGSYYSIPEACYNKPYGLWLSIEGKDGWEEWCKREGFGLEWLEHKYKTTLKEDANILKLTTKAKIKTFSEKYVIYPYACVYPRHNYIDWASVAKDYQGILLTKYQAYYWMEYPWIYPWDCVSACIWDLSCIDKFELYK